MLKRLYLQGLFSSLFFLLGFSAFGGVDGSISGTILDTEGKVVSSIPVELHSPDGTLLQITFSSSEGKYQFFPVILGEYQISVHQGGYSSFLSEVRVVSGANTAADLKLAPDFLRGPKKDLILEVRSRRNLIHNSSAVSSTEIQKSEISKMPQGPEMSLPRLIATTTPGVTQGAFGQMFFRGNHANIQYQIDGVQLPESPSSTFGQAVSPRNIDHMEVITGGIPAEYGQRLSAVVNIVSRSGSVKSEGEIELNYGSYNTFSPHLLYGGSNEKGNVHYFISANYNRSDRGLDTPQPESYLKQDQGGAESIHNSAEGNNEFVKVDWIVDNSNKLSFVVSQSQSSFQIPTYPVFFRPTDDYFQLGYTDAFGNSQGPGAPTYNYVPTATHDSQSEINAYAQILWKHSFSTRSFFLLAPYYKYSLLVVRNDLTNDLASATLIPGANPSSFAQNRHVNNVGLKGDYSLRLDENNLIKAGFQLQGSRSEGPISVQTSSASFLDSSPTEGYFESLYLQDDYGILKSLTLNAGIRFDATQFSFSGMNSNDFLFQPRVGLSYFMTENTKFHVYYGKLFQPAPAESLRYQYNGSTSSFVPLQAYDLQAEKDDFYEFGVAQQFAERQMGMLNFYYKKGINILDDTQLLNTSIAQPYNFAEGYAYGLEVSIKGSLNEEWSEFFNYSYSIAKGKGISGGFFTGVAPGTDFQFLDHVQVHTANAGLSYTKNHFWWTTQGLFGSGLRTGVNNSINLPSHFSFDTSLGYEFHGKSWLSQFKLSGDLINVLDNRYPITIANGYNGSHYAAGRQVFIRLTKSL